MKKLLYGLVLFYLLVYMSLHYLLLIGGCIYGIYRIYHYKRKPPPPLWKAIIPYAPENKQALICILRYMAKAGDARTARAVCHKSWFEDYVIKEEWFNQRAQYVLHVFSLFHNCRLVLLPTEIESTQKCTFVKPIDILSYQNYDSFMLIPSWTGAKMWISFHLEPHTKIPKGFNEKCDSLYKLVAITRNNEYYVKKIK